MDDTAQSRASDAAATRKRRSSILKSQRPARTPFSELEFNVATPTDTAKSRRVSFSRRTGVAEFVTNEATTTWKNFYEEHNKSLESSSNDSEANASRQPVGHLGKRIFDQQFEEVEAVDFIGNVNPHISNGSLNNINFTHQLGSLDCTNDTKLTVPQNKLELSAFTEQQSKLFGNDFIASTIGENSGRIDVNFSNIQEIGHKDDLDEIERDLERGPSNMGCHGPFGRQSLSEYIEVDLNMTHVARNDEDMSITDTIHSPVQDVSKSTSIDKKVSLNPDWAADKENIAVNPYVTPCEADNFAVNEEPNQVLVFDGKRLTLQPDKPEQETEKNYRQTLLPSTTFETPQRKTIVLNVNDDLPNFVDDMLNSKCDSSAFVSRDGGSTSFAVDVPKKAALNMTGNISMTQALPTNIISDTAVSNEGSSKRRTIVFNESMGNISVTQSLPAKLFCDPGPSERRRTVVYENDTGNISITQAVPTNILVGETSHKEKRRTIVFEDEQANISVTQALPSNVILDNAKEKRKTIVFEDEQANISVTQAVPSKVILENNTKEKRKTIVFEDEQANISVTQALPNNVVLDNAKEKRKTLVFEDEEANISVTQALPNNVVLDNAKEKRKTLVFEDEQANISVTQALPNNVVLDNNTKEKRKTIVFEDAEANISVTQALPNNIVLDNAKEKRKTIVFEDDQANMSDTQALPSNVILDNAKEKRQTIVFNDEAGNVSITQALPANIVLPENPTQERRRTIIYEDDVGNISVTQALPTNLILEQEDTVPERRRTVVYGNETGNISITQALQSNVILERVQITDQFNFFATNIRCPPKDSDKRRRTIVYENDTGNISITQAIPAPIIAGSSEESCKTSSDDISFTKLLEDTKRMATVFDKEVFDDVSMTEAVSSKIIDEAASMKKTIVFDDDEADDSMNLALSTNVFLLDKLDSAVEQSVKLPEIAEEVDENVTNYETYEEIQVAKEEVPLDDNKTLHQEDGNMSLTEDIQKEEVQEEVKQAVLYDDSCNMSITKPIPAELVNLEKEMMDKSKYADIPETRNSTNRPTDVLVYQTTTANSAPPALTEQGDLKNLSVTSPTDSKVTSDNKDCKTESVEELDSEDVSLMHPRVAERSDQLDLKTTNSTMDVDKKSVDDPETKPASVEAKESVKIESGKSVLDALLDMSITEGDTEDKDLMTQLDSTHTVSEKRNEKASNISSESMFYVTKDSEDDTQTDRDEQSRDSVTSVKDAQSFPIPYKKDDIEITSLEKKIEQLKTSITKVKDASIINEFYERVVNSDMPHAVRQEETSKIRERSEIFKKANDTKELLDMISDFTEKDEDEYQPIVMKVKAQPVEEKTEVVEPKRLSFAPKRQSIVLSREDLLNNISMAQAVLQKSRLALDDSECVDDTKDSSTASAKKANRTSNEVVKTLHFDDESLSENDFKTDTKYSPLKKTAFGETSYMIENKGKVIPSYLKDVSDGIKELMLDLVKPMADNVPFDNGVDKGVRKDPSTQSTQIQANLVTSSQVDLESELDSYPESNYESDKMSSLAGHTLNKSRSRSFRSPVKFTSNSSEKSSEFEVPSPGQRFMYHHQPSIEQSVSSKVLVFDHLNPLNNIFLSTMDYSDAHKYNPKKSKDTLCGSDPSRSALIRFEDDRKKEFDVDPLTTQFCVKSRQQALQGDGGCKEEMRSSNSRPISTDQSVAAQTLQVKDNEANTLIAMKGNKELLEASSSLTLVDDPLTRDVHSHSTTHSHEMTACRKKKSPVKEESRTENEKLESTEELMEHSPLCAKAKKRIYSPNDKDKYKNAQSSLDVTPKPSMKMQKISLTPKVYKVQIHEDIKHLAAEKDITELPEKQANTSKVIEKRSPKKEKKSPANITVQQLITEYHTVDSGIDKHLLDALTKECSKHPSQSDVDANSLDMVSSFTSSKNLNAIDLYSSSTHSQQFPQEMQRAGKIEWHPELISAVSSVSDADSGVNVVAKIDMLPFMGSHECEWESSSPDTWSFRLLHGRLRLTARLAHRLDNATRTRVRGDTPVLDISVETVQHDKKNPVATMCVRFACETMRYMVSRACRGSCCVASDIPPLLRRCAAVARVALRWGRAMHDAKLHLAYTMDNDGYLTLKVANIPLRSVWEVSMRVELVVDECHAAPWPRAGSVRVARVVSDVPVHEHEVARALAHTPRDWGHAPRTIWRMFRYLKHKTRDDDLLLP